MSERPLAPNTASTTGLACFHGDIAPLFAPTLVLRKPKYRRTRAGCQTCKKRKIGCDLSHPVCKRCITSGRQCGGYPEAEINHTNAAKLLGKKVDEPDLSLSLRPAVVPTIGGNPVDLRYFELFHRSATVIIPGHTPMATWRILIPQLCHREKAIADAALAIAALHEETEFARRSFHDAFGEHSMSPAYTYALKHYGMALRGIQRHLDTGHPSPLIVLVACIIFIAFESMRGHQKAAIAHIQSGNRILEGVKQPLQASTYTVSLNQDSSTQRGARSVAESDSHSPVQEPGQGHQLPQSSQDPEMSAMSRSFSKLSSLIGSSEEQSGDLPPPEAAILPPKLAECPHYFNTLDQARGALFSLMNSARAVVFYCMSQGRESKHSGTQDGHTCILHLDGQLRRWSGALDRLQQRSSVEAQDDPSAPPEDSEIVLLRLWRKYVSIRLWASVLPSQASFDALAPDFEEVLDICERCMTLLIRQHAIRRGSKDHRPPAFIMDMGVLSILFFVGRKSSDIAVKLRALRLVDRAPRREALWDGEIVKSAIRKSINDQLQQQQLDLQPGPNSLTIAELV